MVANGTPVTFAMFCAPVWDVPTSERVSVFQLACVLPAEYLSTTYRTNSHAAPRSANVPIPAVGRRKCLLVVSR